MNQRRLQTMSGLGLLALTASLCLGRPAVAQSAPAPDNQYAQDRDATRDELASFNRFLDSHREIGEQLRKDPNLIDNRDFVRNHPALQDYLRDHPGVREAIRQNPDAFMHAEDRFDRRDDRRGDINRAELANFDRFLDGHPEIADQLRKDPSLMDNREFVQNHPALQAYLQDNPGIRDAVRQNPDAFMHAEDRYVRGDDDRRELAALDGFLDSHREIGEQLRKDPSLVDNQEFVKNHPALQTFLQDHPETSQLLRENPNAFMQEEARYQQQQDMDRDHRGPDRDMDRDTMHRRFGEFLGAHSDLAQELYRNPSQAKDQQFLASHPELRDYLNANPDLREQLAANPDDFVKSSQPFTNGNGLKPPPAAPKPKQ
jgi:hypothetical protein